LASYAAIIRCRKSTDNAAGIGDNFGIALVAS
jgi:hypothetical protein